MIVITLMTIMTTKTLIIRIATISITIRTTMMTRIARTTRIARMHTPSTVTATKWNIIYNFLHQHHQQAIGIHILFFHLSREPWTIWLNFMLQIPLIDPPCWASLPSIQILQVLNGGSLTPKTQDKHVNLCHPKINNTFPETNIAPENGWLEYILVSFWGPAYFQVLCLFWGV